MSQYWDQLAAKSDSMYTNDDFESAAYRLVTEQVLYYSDRNSRGAYWIVERYERDFDTVLAPLGIDVKVNRQMRYAYAIPRRGKVGTASKTQTLFALVLRQVYEDSARVGDIAEDGAVVSGLVDFEEKYRLMTDLSLPGKGELDTLMRIAKRWGIATKSTDCDMEDVNDNLDGQPYAIVIRPAIVDILGEEALQRLSQWSKTEAGNEPSTEDQSNERAEEDAE